MLSELCKELNNWFDKARIFGDFTIEDGVLIDSKFTEKVKDGQYYRIVGSTFNDGVYEQGKEELTDEEFHGAVWLMAVPPCVVELAGDIADWQSKYGSVDSQSMSPYKSESFGGYSYTKGEGSESGSGNTWQSAFSNRMSKFRKVHPY